MKYFFSLLLVMCFAVCNAQIRCTVAGFGSFVVPKGMEIQSQVYRDAVSKKTGKPYPVNSTITLQQAGVNSFNNTPSFARIIITRMPEMDVAELRKATGKSLQNFARSFDKDIRKGLHNGTFDSLGRHHMSFGLLNGRKAYVSNFAARAPGMPVNNYTRYFVPVGNMVFMVTFIHRAKDTYWQTTFEEFKKNVKLL